MTTTSATLETTPGPNRPTSRPAEESGLARIAGWCHDHRWWVLHLAGGPGRQQRVAQAAGSDFSNNLTGARNRCSRSSTGRSPTRRAVPAQVVITSTARSTRRSVQARTAKLVAALRPLAHVSEVVSPFTAGGRPPDLP